ncbi:hypothetical protein BpHYR1_031995 [Brachionus plicatilis]|uniref:Uncharacterized protein n=1 Tax=Brachionus plicatilis TaxID=10195 RepID=A0A3M7SG90_BRAPC|nr:hypothetical protein BpHYR1_031995 [Brachionus plicatilis]
MTSTFLKTSSYSSSLSKSTMNSWSKSTFLRPINKVLLNKSLLSISFARALPHSPLTFFLRTKSINIFVMYSIIKMDQKYSSRAF